MKQGTITHWFGGSTAHPPVEKYYYYLNWCGNYPQQIGWYISEPPGITYQKTLRLRTTGKSVSVVLCGNLVWDDSSLPFSDFDDVERRDDYREYANVPLLKSHLQKCVRRGLDDKSIRTAFHLMRLDFLAFCRRLPIIMVEDTGLHQSLSIVVWLMMAQPDIQPTRPIVRYLLGIVRQLAIDPSYERDVALCSENQAETNFTELGEISDLTRRTLLMSLLARKCYGGMKGDTRLLQQIVDWHYHQPEPVLPSRMLAPITRIRVIDYLGLSELELSGADFHCFPKILTSIHRQHLEYGESEIKTAIWQHSSSINFRTPTYQDKETLVVWQTIQPTYRRVAYSLVQRCY